MDKEQLKKVVNRLIDEEKWQEAARLMVAIESQARNYSVIRNAVESAGDA